MSNDLSSLFEGHCEACEGGVKPLDAETVHTALETLSGWSALEEGASIQRSFSFKNYHQTMAFVNAVAWIAHTEDHHPDMEVSYNACVVTFSTHSVGGVTRNDTLCAAKVNALLRDESDES